MTEVTIDSLLALAAWTRPIKQDWSELDTPYRIVSYERYREIRNNMPLQWRLSRQVEQTIAQRLGYWL